LTQLEGGESVAGRTEESVSSAFTDDSSENRRKSVAAFNEKRPAKFWGENLRIFLLKMVRKEE